MKASELSPRTHHRLAQIFIEAGVPPAAVNVIQTRREDAPAVTEALIAHKAIKKVEFVGSAAVGSIVGSLAGKYLKPVLMELGGKCSAIVLDDADLDDAAGKCIAGGSLTFYSLRPSSPIITPGSRAFLLFTNAQTAFMHHGQICFSTERIIVLESVADEFIELLKQKAAEYISSNAATVNLAQKAHGYLVDAERKGAKYIFGKAEFLSDISLAPALLTGVTKEMSIWDEETFGPSASVFVVDNDNEAVVLANDSVYGLNAAVHTGNMQRALNVGNRLEVGQVHVNALTENDERKSCARATPAPSRARDYLPLVAVSPIAYWVLVLPFY
jgi:acyl-CoA reductase-like NAD-dependent aldehyde dehydrogenase